MSVRDIQGRLCLVKRETCLVYGVMAALVAIAIISICMIWGSDKVASNPVYTLKTQIRVVNSLPRQLDVAQLSIKLPNALDAVVTQSIQPVQIQRGGEVQQLSYSPANVAAGAEVELSVDLTLVDLPLSEKESTVEQGSSANRLPRDEPTPAPAILPSDLSAAEKQLDPALHSVVKQANSLAEYQRLFSQLDPARSALSTELPLQKEQAQQYAYLLGLLLKSVDLKQPLTLVSGWVFDPDGRGSYQLWAESHTQKQTERWPSPGEGNGVIYLPSGEVNIAEFISNPAPIFSPVSGFGLEVKELNMTLQKQK